MSFLKHLRERWNNWVGDRDMELAIRQHLSQSGYFGRTARLQNVRLVAVQRPGWLQVLRFEATARLQPAVADDESPDAEAEYHDLCGLVRSDARKDSTTVRVFRDEDARRRLFAQWSEDLICLRGAQGLSYTKAEQQVHTNTIRRN